MRRLLNDLIEVLTLKGSKIRSLMLSPLSDSEMIDIEKQLGGGVAPDLRDFWVLLGRGFEKNSGRHVDTQLIPDFVPFTCQGAILMRNHYRRSDVLGADLLKGLKLKVDIVPVMSNGPDFISCFSSQVDQGLLVKVNAFGYPSELWGSLEDLLRYSLRCWEQGVFWIDQDNDEIKTKWEEAATIKRSEFNVLEIGGRN
ncbi:hypothetical protein [Verrucomicrobium spinosum]|uniref:hypothetical protein n=1 Tax=Verrucomicrobium spinosum TaxID=2736 RepID=UPI00094618C0|nr:hypothetical protein [Verrucomicrobium spinosum]